MHSNHRGSNRHLKLLSSSRDDAQYVGCVPDLISAGSTRIKSALSAPRTAINPQKRGFAPCPYFLRCLPSNPAVEPMLATHLPLFQDNILNLCLTKPNAAHNAAKLALPRLCWPSGSWCGRLTTIYMACYLSSLCLTRPRNIGATTGH